MTTAHFCKIGDEVREKPLHYTLCGLDNIYLQNGFTCEMIDGEEAVAIHKADELHEEIGVFLVTHNKTLSPKEFKFLRKQMDCTQDRLGHLIGVTGQTIARYEKGETEISGGSDRTIRFFYILSLLPEEDALRLLKEFRDRVERDEEVDETRTSNVLFHVDADGWNEAEAA